MTLGSPARLLTSPDEGCREQPACTLRRAWRRARPPNARTALHTQPSQPSLAGPPSEPLQHAHHQPSRTLDFNLIGWSYERSRTSPGTSYGRSPVWLGPDDVLGSTPSTP